MKLKFTAHLIGILPLLLAASVGADMPFPEPNPPTLELPAAASRELGEAVSPSSTPTMEWIYHRSLDGLHPDGTEQQMLWLFNRARQDPAAEGDWLAVVDDTGHSISQSRTAFGVNTTVLRNEFATYSAKPPLAFDRRLYDAAKAHSDYLISIDGQNHDGQIGRITSAGFFFSSYGGNVFSYAANGLHAHAGFNIDWGYGTDGTQDPPGHRNTIMSVNQDLSNVGIAAVPESNNATHVGPLVVTTNHAYAITSYADHYNKFIVGAVWRDSNSNDLYDPGEGIAGITVKPDNGGYYAVTSAGGGYAIPVADGSYQVTFSGNGVATTTRNISISGASALLDFEVGSAATNQPPVASFSAIPTSGPAPLTVAVDAAGSYDSDGSISRYAWSISDGRSASGAQQTFVFSSPGIYTITLTVTDNQGATDITRRTVTAADPLATSTYWLTSEADALGVAQQQGKWVILVAGRDTCGNTNYTRNTVFQDPQIKALIDEHFVLWYGNVDIATDYYPYASGLTSYTLPLICSINPAFPDKCVDRTTDIQDISSTYSRLQQLAAQQGTVNKAPTAAFTVSSTYGTAPLTVTVDGSGSSDPDGSIAGYSWSTSDGKSASGAKASFTFSTPGSYAISLKVTDDDGAEGHVQRTVTVISGSTEAPDPLPETLSAGRYHSCAIKADGTLACWGNNYYGQSSPPAGVFSQVSSGYFQNCAVRSDHAISCWGANDYGQSSPPAGSYNQVSVGSWNSACAVAVDGTLRCWGGENLVKSSPPSGVYTQVSVGNYFACAIRKADGAVNCWGDTSYGVNTPPPGSFVQVHAGHMHACAVRKDGAVLCWGSNQDPYGVNFGQAMPPTGTFREVSAGYVHSCALDSNGFADCWGDDAVGQATPPDFLLPSPVPPGYSHYTEIATGDEHSCARFGDGSVECWGGNVFGESTPPDLTSPPNDCNPVDGNAVIGNRSYSGISICTAQKTIAASNVQVGGTAAAADVTYRAGTSITLRPNFRVFAGSRFIATLGGGSARSEP